MNRPWGFCHRFAMCVLSCCLGHVVVMVFGSCRASSGSCFALLSQGEIGLERERWVWCARLQGSAWLSWLLGSNPQMGCKDMRKG